MKLIALAGIRHSEKSWDHLVDAFRQQKPDLVAIADDLVPKGSGILGQFDDLPHVKRVLTHFNCYVFSKLFSSNPHILQT